MMLSEKDYQEAATVIGVEKNLIKAVAEVESAGEAFLPDGRTNILFEKSYLRKADRTHIRQYISLHQQLEMEQGVV